MGYYRLISTLGPSLYYDSRTKRCDVSVPRRQKNLGRRSGHERPAACRGIPTDPPSPAPPRPATRRAAPDAGCRRVTERKEGPRRATPPASAAGHRRSTEGRGPRGRDSSRPQTASPAPIAGRRPPLGHGGEGKGVAPAHGVTEGRGTGLRATATPPAPAATHHRVTPGPRCLGLAGPVVCRH